MIVNKDLIREIELTQVSPSLVIAKGDKGDTGSQGPQGPQGETGAIEIYSSTSGVVEYSNFTGAQLIAKCAENKYFFTYKGAPVMYAAPASFGSTDFVFVIIEKGVNSGTASPRVVCRKVDSDKQITSSSMRSMYIPFSVNGKTFLNGENITLQAGDISAANNWSPTNNTDLATKKYVDDNAKALIVTLTEENDDLEADATPAEIYAAWTAGKPIFVKPSDSDFYVPLLSAKYEDDAYAFFAMATEAISGTSAVTTWYANYDENGWEVSSESVLGLPGVSSADEGKIPIVTNLGGWDLQKLPIVIGSTDSQAADYISPSDAITAVSAGKTLVITHTDSVYSMGAVQFNSFVVRGGAAIVGMMAADNGSGVTLANLIGASGSWNFSIYNIPGTGSVASGNAGYVTGGAVYTALQNAGVKEYTITAEVWDETPGYMWLNQNATDNPFVWLYATADLTAEGQPLENAFITGVEVSSDGTTWVNVLCDCSLDYQPQVANKPALITETTDDYGTCTAVVFGNKNSAMGIGLTNANYIKIHFIKTTDGGAV